jgi:hypothetical protein
MNLLDRLKPEYLEKLNLLEGQYPTSVEKIKLSLNENQSVFGLTISEASSICLYFDIEMNINNLLNLIKDDE